MNNNLKEKIENIKIEIQSAIFYSLHKKTGITKEYITFLFYNKPRTQNILNLIKSCKSIDELRKKTKQQFNSISRDLCIDSFIDGVQTGVFHVVNIHYYSPQIDKLFLDNDYSKEDLEQLITNYKDVLYEYIINNNKTKNSIQRGNEIANDFTKDITPELLEKIYKTLFVNKIDLTEQEKANYIVIKKLLFKIQCIYPKEIIKSNPEFVKFEILTGKLDEYFDRISNTRKVDTIVIPDIKERMEYYEQRKSLTVSQNLQLNQIELLENRINKLNHPNKSELIELLKQIKEEKNILKKAELVEECNMLYEITFREEIVDSLFTPSSSTEITDIDEVENCLIHIFIPRSGNLLKGYDEKLKQKLINESNDRRLNRELTEEEQKKFDQLMEYAKNVLANKLVTEETIETDLIYSDSGGIRHYKSDTSNQISTSILTAKNILGFGRCVGIGYDKNTLSPLNIAISSASYKTTNMGIENLEINLEHQFKELSAPLSELEDKSQTEIVLFRKGMETFTKTAYVFASVYSTTDPKDKEKIEEARQLAKENNLKLIIFNLGKIKESIKKYDTSVEIEEKKMKSK